jgi:hypothetical protein
MNHKGRSPSPSPLSARWRGLLLRVSHPKCFFEASSLLGIGLSKRAHAPRHSAMQTAAEKLVVPSRQPGRETQWTLVRHLPAIRSRASAECTPAGGFPKDNGSDQVKDAPGDAPDARFSRDGTQQSDGSRRASDPISSHAVRFLGGARAPWQIAETPSRKGKVSRLSGREAQMPHAPRADGRKCQRHGKAVNCQCTQTGRGQACISRA